MIAFFAFVFLTMIVGAPLVRLFDASVRGPALVGTACLAGCGIFSLEMLGCSLLGVTWTRASILAPILIIAFSLWLLAWRTGRVEMPGRLRFGGAVGIDVLTAVVVAGHAVFATLAPTAENDFMTIWGLKAKTFWIAGGVDFGFLSSPWSVLFHVDYPVLLPLVYDAVAVLHGGWLEAPLGAFASLFGAAALLAVRGESARELGPFPSAVITLAMTGILLSPWIGLADGPLAAYLVVAALLIRRGLNESSPATIRAGALMVGCAAFLKNEGIALLAAVAVALLVASRKPRTLADLWPAPLVAAPWLILRWFHHFSTDLAREGVALRIFDRLGDPGALVAAIAGTWVGRPLLWIGVAIGVGVVAVPLIRKERFAITLVTIQVMSYLLAYMASPHDLTWHVTWSWERLVSHVTPLIVFTIAARLVGELGTGSSTMEAG